MEYGCIEGSAVGIFKEKLQMWSFLTYKKLMQSNSFSKNCKFAAQGTSTIPAMFSHFDDTFSILGKNF